MEKYSRRNCERLSNMNLVSVIIPTYNEEKDIENCIKSLKNQAFQDFEIIIVDDGSTDNTLKILEKLEKEKIKTLNQQHKGPGEARNLGAKNASGKILVFIDSDMTFDKNYIKNLIEPILNDKEQKIIGTTHDYEVAVNTENKWSRLWGAVRVSKNNAKDVKIFRAIKKDSFMEYGGFDRKYGYADDQTFWFKHHLKPVVAQNTTCYHKNPETLKGTYRQAKWIGTSWKEKFFVFRVPIIGHLFSAALIFLIPFAVIAKSLTLKMKSRFAFLDLIKFYSLKFFGYYVGIVRAVYLNRFSG